MSKEEPAFPPTLFNIDEKGNQFFYGLTKREWFAGMALQGMLSSRDKFWNGDGTSATEPKHFSEISFIYADAMIEASKS